MGIFRKAKTESKKPTDPKESDVRSVKEAPKKPVASGRQILKKEFSGAYRILRRPLVTEKSVNLGAEKNQYAFAVASGATKNEVKKAIQDLYGVRVARVNILNTRGKKRRVGKYEGRKSGFKKASVFLAEGEKIEVISR